MKPPPGSRQISPGSERFNIILQQYPLYYQLSASRKEKFYEKDITKLTKTLQRRLDAGELDYRPRMPKTKKAQVKVCLFDTKTQEFVLANPRAAGTAKLQKISGQDFWASGPGQQWNRQKLKDQLGEFFTPRIVNQLPKKIWPPKGSYIQMEYVFYTDLDAVIGSKERAQDIDNHSGPYMKVFKDTLQYLGVIAGDDPSIVRGSYARYVQTADPEARRLEVKFHFCHNEQPVTPPLYEYNEITVDREEFREEDPF